MWTEETNSKGEFLTEKDFNEKALKAMKCQAAKI